VKRILVVMTREDGSEEGNDWEYAGSDKQLYSLFSALCHVIINWPQVVLPDDGPEEDY